MSEEELHEWIHEMSKGNKAAFQAVYDHSRDHVFRTVSFLVNNKQDVYDVVSEVYMEIFKSIASFNFQKPFRSWLNGLIIRQTQNWNRKLWRRFRLNDRNKLMQLDERDSDTEQIHLQNEQSAELISLVRKLSYKHSVVIVLRYFQDCSFEEISDALGIPLGTVKSRHHTALEKLRKNTGFEMKDNEEALQYVHRKPAKTRV
jgi:RNA polymerase sigma-70 factor (ECF subfamily)